MKKTTKSLVKLTDISLPDSVTVIGFRAFYDCTSLEEINVSSGNQNYSSDFGVLFNKNGSVLIQYPCGNNNIKYDIPDSVTEMESYAFSSCQNLSSIIIPDNIEKFDLGVFSGWTEKQTIYIEGRSTAADEWNSGWCENCNAKIVWNDSPIEYTEIIC